jgi:hypothetical protein
MLGTSIRGNAIAAISLLSFHVVCLTTQVASLTKGLALALI